MKLTGKCLEDFEKWLEESEHYYNLPYSDFIQFTESMQWGVIQDFADGFGYFLDVQIMTSPTMQNDIFNGFKAFVFHNGKFKSSQFKTADRNIARTAAVNKFNELYNGIR